MSNYFCVYSTEDTTLEELEISVLLHKDLLKQERNSDLHRVVLQNNRTVTKGLGGQYLCG